MSDYYVFTDFESNGLEPAGKHVPIEIGAILTDDEYNILDSISCYINPFDEDKNKWDEDELPAHRVHTIPFNTIKRDGVSPIQTVEMISRMLEAQKAQDKFASRYIIMSDNGQFEYNAMHKLYTLAEASDSFPFHYAAWDINILINSVQKVQKGKGSHKAIQDAFRTYKAVIRALERNGFRKWEK